MKNKFLLFLAIAMTITGLVGIFGLGVKNLQVKRPPIKIQSQTPVVNEPVQAKYEDFHLEIPGLKISAPIIADVPGDERDVYFKALESGLAHYKGTKKPGEGGNIFIYGHSSFYWWKPGDYKDIFKNLEKIKTDDEIIVWWQGKEYKYKVTETKVVKPTETSVLQNTPSEQITLMTCTPVGTDLNRFIVIAKPF